MTSPTVAFPIGLILAVAGFLVTRALLSPMVTLLYRGGLTARNYAGKSIPTGGGILLPIGACVPLIAVAPFAGTASGLWILLMFSMGLIGFFDDAAGDGTTRGFSGHIKALIALKPTTGSIKAFIGGLLSLYAGWILHESLFHALLSGTLIALSTNAINLLDVRPGRALKGYFLLTLIGFIGGWRVVGPSSNVWHLPLAAAPLGVALALSRADLSGRIMLGDAGANALGAAAGLLLAQTSVATRVSSLLLFVFIHAVAEKTSISTIIESVPLLRAFDEWGRRPK